MALKVGDWVLAPFGLVVQVVSVSGPSDEVAPYMKKKCDEKNWNIGVTNGKGPAVYWYAEDNLEFVMHELPEKFNSPEECEAWLDAQALKM